MKAGWIERFVTALSRTSVDEERACNQYAQRAPNAKENAIRRRNLRLYLDEMTALRPRMLLVGEAVSHRGGRLTGIAFVSERIMLDGLELASGRRILGASHGYAKANPRTPVSTEASATMVWGTIRSIDPLPLLWNAFPFHPHDRGNPLSNRVPSFAELAAGAGFIQILMREFDIDCAVAIGNQAAASLSKLGIEHTKVRHPSQGGKTKFVDGMARLVQRRNA